MGHHSFFLTLKRTQREDVTISERHFYLWRTTFSRLSEPIKWELTTISQLPLFSSGSTSPLTSNPNLWYPQHLNLFSTFTFPPPRKYLLYLSVGKRGCFPSWGYQLIPQTHTHTSLNTNAVADRPGPCALTVPCIPLPH